MAGVSVKDAARVVYGDRRGTQARTTRTRVS